MTTIQTVGITTAARTTTANGIEEIALGANEQDRVDLSRLSHDELVAKRTQLELRVAKLDRERRVIQQKVDDMQKGFVNRWKNRGYGLSELREVNAISAEVNRANAMIGKINLELRIQ